MTAEAVHRSTSSSAAADARERGHIGLIVLCSIATGSVLGLLLVLAVFGGGAEAQITGGALLALGSGFTLLALASRRLADQPQEWALVPGAAAIAAGLGLVVLGPGDRFFTLVGWVWPLLLLLLVAWSFRGARRSLHNWSRRALLYPALFVLLLVAVGGAHGTVAEATADSAEPTGRTYLVDGHRLYLHCVGAGAPTVVLFNGLAERTPSWAWVQRTLSSTTRVCVFDRAGQGWSEAAPGRQDGHHLAADLHGLLEAARVPGPYVLAGHSVGGAYALVYAARYPKQVAGVALVDSATPHQFELPDYPRFYSTWRRASALLPSLSRAGIGRLVLGSGFAGLPPDARDQARTFATSPRELSADRTEFLQLPTVFEQAKALTSLGNRPLSVVTATDGQQRGWFASQVELARLSTNSVHRTVQGSTHSALLEDERFASATTRAIAEVVRLARSETDR